MVAYVNGDGIPDIPDLERDTLQIYLGNGNGTYEPPFYIGNGPSPGSILTANLHGHPASKGLPDLGLLNERGDHIRYRMRRDKTLRLKVPPSIGKAYGPAEKGSIVS